MIHLTKGFWTLSFFHILCMKFAGNQQYTLIHTTLLRFLPHNPPSPVQRWLYKLGKMCKVSVITILVGRGNNLNGNFHA